MIVFTGPITDDALRCGDLLFCGDANPEIAERHLFNGGTLSDERVPCDDRLVCSDEGGATVVTPITLTATFA